MLIAPALASGSTFAIGTTTVTCTATDAASNTAKTSFTVTVRDTTAPVFGAVSNVTAEATSSLGAAVTYVTPAAADAVGATVSCAPASGATFPIGTTAVTCTAKDAAANSSTAAFTVTVKDTKAPVLTITGSSTTLIWSPNKILTPVTISGKITDVTRTSASYKVLDEYGKIQPSGTVTVAADGSYSFVVKLEAYRNGTDSNGRLYTITVTALDSFGNSGSIQTFVTVPHSQ